MLMLTQKQYLDNIAKRFKISPISLERATGNSFTRYGFFPLDLANYTRDELISRRFCSTLVFMRRVGDQYPYLLRIKWRIKVCNDDIVRFYVKGRDFTNGEIEYYRFGERLEGAELEQIQCLVIERILFNHNVRDFYKGVFFRYRLSFIFNFPCASIRGKHIHHVIQDNPAMRLRAWDDNKYLPLELTAATFDHPFYLLALTEKEHIDLHDIQGTLYFGNK